MNGGYFFVLGGFDLSGDFGLVGCVRGFVGDGKGLKGLGLGFAAIMISSRSSAPG